MPHAPHAELFVGAFFEVLNPIVGNAHGKPVIKTKAAVLDVDAHARHAAHILCDSDDIRCEFVDKFVGQLQVVDGFDVGVHAEILVVMVEGFAESMVVVEH